MYYVSCIRDKYAIHNESAVKLLTSEYIHTNMLTCFFLIDNRILMRVNFSMTFVTYQYLNCICFSPSTFPAGPGPKRSRIGSGSSNPWHKQHTGYSYSERILNSHCKTYVHTQQSRVPSERSCKWGS